MKFLQFNRLFDLLPFLVHEEHGILSHIISLPRQADMPDFIYYKVVVANTGIFGGQENRPVAGGTALDPDRALAKAVGEGIERYASGIYHWDELIMSTYQDLPHKASGPEKYSIFSQNQLENPSFPFQEFNAHTVLRWSKAKNLRSMEDVLVPSCMVYCPYQPDVQKGEIPIVESISTGLAAHLSYKAATLNGILEVVERDSFMLSWLCGRSAPQLDHESLLPDHLEMIRRFSKVGYQIKLLDIRADTGIPSILGIMKGHFKGAVPFLVAAATHLNPEVAITKCLEELALIERYGKRVMMTPSRENLNGNYQKVNHLIDHILFWLDPSQTSKSDFLWNSPTTIPLDSIPNLSIGSLKKDLETAVNLVNNVGHEVVVADITTSDAEQLGFKVVRAIIPGFLPLNKRYDCRPLGSKRLRFFLEKQNLSSPVNRLPHPFA